MTKPTEKKKPKPPKVPVAKAATNPFLVQHPTQSGRTSGGLSRGTKRGR